jgi:hypothetical protein
MIAFFIVATKPVWAASCCLEADGSFDQMRFDSATTLTRQAIQLVDLNENIFGSSRDFLVSLAKENSTADVLKGEVQSSSQYENIQSKRAVQSKKFQRLLLDYQDARRRYLEHKLLYDEHVAEYHRQAQVSGSDMNQENQLDSPDKNQKTSTLVLPDFKPLKLRVRDACSALQKAEQSLTNSESQLSALINVLASVRGKVGTDNYFQKWTEIQSVGVSLQSRVMDFGHEVLAKEQTSEDELASLTQAAERNGDYVESQRAYSELQRRTALSNEETDRAHAHTVFATAALNAINMLSPIRDLCGPPSGVERVSADSVESESRVLQNEYDSLQTQYREVELANPAN